MTASGRSLRDALEDYLALRRAPGFRLAAPARLLGQFVSYLQARGTSTITTADALSGRSCRPGHRRPGRRSGSARSAGSPSTCTAPTRQWRFPRAGLIRRGNDRATPYLYSDAEISAIITAAGTLRPRFRAATYQALISLLAVSGIRIGEAFALDRGDLDTGGGILIIRDAKFGKTRLVPLHSSATAALTRYSALRDEHHPRPAAPALLLSTAGTRLLHSNVGLTFTQLTRQAGLTRRSASCRPRIHDYADLRVMPTSRRRCCSEG